MRTRLRRALCSALFLCAPPLLAQPTPPFGPCAEQTGSSATLLISSSASISVALEEAAPQPIEIGDVLAVLTPEGLCAGALTWLDDTAALALWEDDPATPEKEGFALGDPLTFSLWRSSSGQELRTAVAPAFDTLFGAADTFVPNAVYAVTDLTFDQRAGGEGALDFTLGSNYPNPFADHTTLRYALPEAAHVRLSIYDVRGRRVATLVDGHVEPGRHEARLDAAGLASGTYLARLSAGDRVEVRRLQLVR